MSPKARHTKIGNIAGEVLLPPERRVAGRNRPVENQIRNLVHMLLDHSLNLFVRGALLFVVKRDAFEAFGSSLLVVFRALLVLCRWNHCRVIADIRMPAGVVFEGIGNGLLVLHGLPREYKHEKYTVDERIRSLILSRQRLRIAIVQERWPLVKILEAIEEGFLVKCAKVLALFTPELRRPSEVFLIVLVDDLRPLITWRPSGRLPQIPSLIHRNVAFDRLGLHREFLRGLTAI
ncbi:hypothetical protein V2G26_014617 [Clonostachys chloroleuca]